MSVQAQLQRLGITLPPAPAPVGAYIPCVVTGRLLFVSGQLPLVEGTVATPGKVGGGVTLEQGQEACRQATLNALAVVAAAAGELDRVQRIVRLGVYVASAPGFNQQPAVANGASELLAGLFGETGRHARFAVGVAELPLDAPVEIELIVELKD